MSSFLSYSIFWLIPGWSRETHHVYLFAWASKTHARGSPRWGTLHYSSGHLWPYVDGISLLSEALLAFYVNQGIQPLSLLYSRNCKLFPYLSLNLYISLAMPSLLRITLDPRGLVPSNQASIFPPTLIKPWVSSLFTDATRLFSLPTASHIMVVDSIISYLSIM